MFTRKTAIALVLVIGLCGCGDQRVLERLGFTQTTSYDLVPGGMLKVAVAIPKSDVQTDGEREILTTTARSSKEARIALSRQTNLILVSGQLRNVLFGLSLARIGMWKHIDTLVRDPSIAPQVKVTVVNGTAEDMLKKEYKQHPLTGKYIDRMLEKEAKWHTVPRVTLYEFTRDYYDDGIDPVAPVVKDDGDDVIIDGIGLFRDDRYVTKIPPVDAIVFAFLRGDFKQGEISMELEGGPDGREFVMFSNLTSKRKVKVRHLAGGNIQVVIRINVKGSVLEHIGKLKLSNDKQRKQLEKRISEHISGETERLVAMMQKNRVDSVGIGTYVRNSMSFRSWKKLNWREAYPEIQVKCMAHVKIKDYGKFR